MTDDSNTEDEIVLSAEYALGLLTPGEAVAFEDVLSVDPEMREQYASWAESLATLTDEIAPVDPPKAPPLATSVYWRFPDCQKPTPRTP